MFAAIIGLVFAAHKGLTLNAVPAFWLAYIVTRPLGASLGDFQPSRRGFRSGGRSDPGGPPDTGRPP